MPELLDSADRWIFHLFNRTLTNPVFDVVMPFLTDINRWSLPFIVIVVGVLIFGPKRARAVLLVALILIGLSDYLTSGIMKPLFGRLRPCKDLDIVRLLVRCGGRYGFPSGHAANSFAAAVWLSGHYRHAKPYLLALAGLIAFTRVYVGVHYPIDITAGAAIGSGLSFLALIGQRRVESWASVRGHSWLLWSEREEEA